MLMSGNKPGVARLGLPYRTGVKPWLEKLQSTNQLSFVEFHIEQFDPAGLDYADTLASCGIAVIIHVTTDLISPSAEEVLTQRLLAIAAQTPIAYVSGHIASGRSLTKWGGEAFNRFPYTNEYLHQILKAIRRLEHNIGIPVGLENVATYGNPPDDEITELAFLEMFQRDAPGRLVFDVSNLVANSINYQSHFPNEGDLMVLNGAYLHLSGGRWHDNKYIDTHRDPIDISHATLAKPLVPNFKYGILYERDCWESVNDIERDLALLHTIIESTASSHGQI